MQNQQMVSGRKWSLFPALVLRTESSQQLEERFLYTAAPPGQVSLAWPTAQLGTKSGGGSQAQPTLTWAKMILT